MGYYTRYDLDVVSDQSDPVELERFLKDRNSGKTFGSYDLPLDLSDSESMKWYDWQEDMVALSKEYPNVLLTLSGEGEESGDIWKAYFMNGEAQHVAAKIVFSDPDFSKFKKIDLTEKRAKEIEETRIRLEAELSAKKLALEIETNRIQQELDKLNSA